MNLRQRKQYYKETESKRMQIEKKYLPKFVKLFKRQLGQFLSNAKLTNLQTAYAAYNAQMYNQDLLSLLKNMYGECISKIGYPIYTTLYKQADAEFIKQKAFATGAMGTNEVFTAAVLELFAQYGLTLINWIDTTNKNTLLKIITDGYANDLTEPQIIDKIISSGLADQSRALRIVRTETTRAVNAGIMQAGRQQRFQMLKAWISTLDGKERMFGSGDNYDHKILDNTTVLEFEPFRQVGKNGVEAVAMQPGDITAPADFTINCRCIIGFRFAKDANGKLIRKNVINLPVNTSITNNNNFIQNIANLSANNKYSNVKEVKEAIKNAFEKNIGLKINSILISKNLSINDLNKRTNTINLLTQEYNISENIIKDHGTDLIMKSTKTFYGYVKSSTSRIATINFGDASDKSSSRKFNITDVREREKSRVDDNNLDIATLVHEFAHVIATEKQEKSKPLFDDLRKIFKEYSEEKKVYIKNNDTYNTNQISLGNYSKFNLNEFMAEGFTEYKLSSNKSKYAILIGKAIDKYYKK